jgi:hypothetical protein
MRHIHSSIPVLVLALLPACGPGGFTAQALDSSETDSASAGELDESAAEDDGWEAEDGEWESDDDNSEDEGESDESDEGDGDGDDSGDGDGDNGGLPNGFTCTVDDECASLQCQVIPFLGGQCGECNEDSDCMNGGCTDHNPFVAEGSHCNFGELGGGCEDDGACSLGLECSTVMSLFGILEVTTCGECLSDDSCPDGLICAPLFSFQAYGGARTCVLPNSLPHDAYCDIENNGDLACASGICSPADIMGLAQVGTCGECHTDDDCGDGTCVPATFTLDTGALTGSWCDA